MTTLTEKILKDPEVKSWNSLATCTLARILCFNKRRAVERARMTVSQFNNLRPAWGKGNQELVATLKPIERNLMKK